VPAGGFVAGTCHVAGHLHSQSRTMSSGGDLGGAGDQGGLAVRGKDVVVERVARLLGLDVDVTILHDRSGADVGAAELFVGAGVGFSVFVETWTISPYVNLFRDVSVAGWALVPGINLSTTR